MFEKFNKNPKTDEELSAARTARSAKYQKNLERRLAKDARRIEKGKAPKHTVDSERKQAELDKMSPEARAEVYKKAAQERAERLAQDRKEILDRDKPVLRNLGDFAAGQLLVVARPEVPRGHDERLDDLAKQRFTKIAGAIGELAADKPVTMSVHYWGGAAIAPESRQSAQQLHGYLAEAGVNVAHEAHEIDDQPNDQGTFNIRRVANSAFRAREIGGEDSYHVAVVGTTDGGHYFEPDDVATANLARGDMYQVNGTREDGHLDAPKIAND